ncbi:unnamed protein product [Pedinophyceae sp. YPF-701]|nr:unnamed protein product [Pedinophyceae sp. YPF-701]
MDDADSGVSLLVNRGWVPADVAQDPARKGEWQPAGVVEVEGLVRGSEDPGRSGVANDVGAQQWHYIDVPLLAQAMGLHESTPMVEVVREGGYVEERPNTGMGALKGRTGRDAGGERGDMSLPVVRAPEAFESHAVMPVDHLGYAFTWFGLSVSAIGMAAVHRYARSRRSRLKGGPMGLGKRPTFRV